MNVIRVGTCSWTEKSLIQSGEFYPKGMKTAEDRLRYHSSHFDTVEVDSTYYAIPVKNTASLWAQRTPDNFIFHIKVYGALTGHGVDPRSLPAEIRSELQEKDKKEKNVFIREPSLLRMVVDSFKDSLLPLMNAGKLGILIFQFPPWFVYKEAHLEYILSCKEKMGRMPVAVEFRHGSWYEPLVREKVFHFLRKNQIIHIVADEPQYDTLATVPFVPQTTADIAYYRFHGRNKENWLKKGIETSLRYAYEYSDEELKEFAPHVETSAKIAKKTYVMFNNCHGGSAMRNAERMKVILKG